MQNNATNSLEATDPEILKPPTPKQIAQTRIKADLTQEKAAALIHITLRTWQRYEYGDRVMHLAMWELFLIKTGNRK